MADPLELNRIAADLESERARHSDALSVLVTRIHEQAGPVPQPPTPTPPPVGIPYPPLYSRVSGPTDLSKLDGDTTLEPGEYTASGNILRNVVARVPLSVTLKLGKDQCPRFPDVFAGLHVKGGGVKNSDDLEHSGPRAGLLVHTCRHSESEGYGLLVLQDGARVVNTEIDNNGSGGIGGTGGKNVALFTCHVHHNNLKYKRKNSGGGKWTRVVLLIDGCDYHDNAGGDAWGDNYCELLRVVRSKFVGGTTDGSGDPWKRNNLRGEISKRFEVEDCEFHNDHWAAICVNEVRDGFKIAGNKFSGKAKAAIEFRDMARNGFKLGRGTVSGNTFATNDLGLKHSGSGADISLSKLGIVIAADNRWPDGAQHIDKKLN